MIHQPINLAGWKVNSQHVETLVENQRTTLMFENMAYDTRGWRAVRLYDQV
jgi:hypothetical protein